MSVDLENGPYSELAYVIKKMAAIGYGIIHWFVSKAEQHGSGAVRWRIYIISIRFLQSIASNVPQLREIITAMAEMSRALKTDSGRPSDCLSSIAIEDAVLEEDEPKVKKAKGIIYKDEHLEAFHQANLEWPPCYEDAPELLANGMTPRVKELVFYAIKMFKHTAARPPPFSGQFFDANYSMKRAVMWDEGERLPKCQDMWKDLLPCITTKSVMIVRYLDPSSEIELVRIVSGHECMMFQGWPRARLHEILRYEHSDMMKCAGGACLLCRSGHYCGLVRRRTCGADRGHRAARSSNHEHARSG